MKREQQLSYKVMHNFVDTQKIEVFDLLHRIGVLLYYAKAIYMLNTLKSTIQSDMDQESAVDFFGFNILPDRNFCELEGLNYWIHIYKKIVKQLLFIKQSH